MHDQNRHARLLALGLAMLAGFVDAMGFLALGGVFVSFMSGNSTRLGAGIAQPDHLLAALLPFAVIVLFVIGVMIGKIIRHKRKNPATVILSFMTVMLLLAAASYQTALPHIPFLFMILAMGSANNVFVRGGEVAIGVTYMTGTLVKLGQRLANVYLGEARHDWKPYLFLWCALVSGAVMGAACFYYAGLSGLWIAGLFCAMLVFTARKLDKEQTLTKADTAS